MEFPTNLLRPTIGGVRKEREIWIRLTLLLWSLLIFVGYIRMIRHPEGLFEAG